MTADIIDLKKRRGDDDAWTPEQQAEDMFDLHQRLMQHLAQDKPYKGEPMLLSIDDVMQLCGLIEDSLGHEWFDDDLD